MSTFKPWFKPYINRAGKSRFKPSQELVELLMEEQEGFCIACNDTLSGVEPDARKLQCESCGEHTVYGPEELVLMGLVY